MTSSSVIPCSVLVLTRNSAKSLERCLRNLGRFGEVLIHDANSEDDTVAIATRLGAKVLKQYETAEKSVRVKNFTEMRLKQRAAAAYDWVLYLDSDEYLSDELAEEIGEILATAAPKTMIKVPRLPVIEGRIRTHGVFYPEVMPRLHHRLSGATLQAGKTVHEKYVFDESFSVIVTKNPLLFPLETVADLRSKDDRYLTLEVEGMRKNGYSFAKYVRWILLREPLIMVSILLRIACNLPRYLSPDEVPIAHDMRYVSYHWRILRAVTGLMAERLF